MKVLLELKDLTRILSNHFKLPEGVTITARADPFEVEISGVEYEPTTPGQGAETVAAPPEGVAPEPSIAASQSRAPTARPTPTAPGAGTGTREDPIDIFAARQYQSNNSNAPPSSDFQGEVLMSAPPVTIPKMD